MDGTKGRFSKRRKFSTRLIRKGALVQETYLIFQHWRPEETVRENLARIQTRNPIGAKSQSWLIEVIRTISSRFTHGSDVVPLVMLAKAGYPLVKWRNCLLWHVGQTDEIYYQFATEWLFEQFKLGTHLMKTDHVLPFVRQVTGKRAHSGGGLSEYGEVRAARDLLRMSSEFGLLTGSAVREFASFHLDDEVFLYVLHAMAEGESNANTIVSSQDWRLFLMFPDDVEREFLRLHQFRKLHYEVAGSLARLELPSSTLAEYVKGLI